MNAASSGSKDGPESGARSQSAAPQFAARLGLSFLAGFLVATGLMVIDELLTLAQYCGRECRYAIPLLGHWTIYDASGFAWALVLAGIGLLLVEAVKFPRR